MSDRVKETMSDRNEEVIRPTVCQVLHSLEIGGAEVLAAGLARSLQGQFRFVFACLDGIGALGEQLIQEGFTVELLGRSAGIDWKCGRRLGAFLSTQQAAAVHAHQYTPFFQSLIARIPQRRLPIIFTEHGRHFPDIRSTKRVAVNRLLMRRGDRVIGVGNSVRQALIENEGIDAQRVEVIYNGVDLEPFSAVCGDHERRQRVRNDLGIADSEQVILQVARLNPLKDHRTAVAAVRRLQDAGCPVRLVLAGDGEERLRIESAVREAELESQVMLLGARHDIPDLLCAADAFVLSSISEGIPLTIIEAMAAGVPVVATQVGGIAEVIEHEVSGLLVPERDPGHLAGALQRVLTDVPARQKMIAAARETAGRRFSREEMHSRYADVYRSCLQHGSGQPSVSAHGAVDDCGRTSRVPVTAGGTAG